MEEISSNLIPQTTLSTSFVQPVYFIGEWEQKLKRLTLQMEEHSKKGKYILAENCRIASEKLKKRIDLAKVKEIIKRQKKQCEQIKDLLKEESKQLNEQWDNKMATYEQQARQLQRGLSDKHQKEWQQAKLKIEEEIPIKCKDSSQCLNLRKIEQGLAKQHSYLQAHKVQQIIKAMEEKEQQAWAKIRLEKIQAKQQELSQRQSIEMQSLKKRIQSGKWQLQVQRTKEEAKLLLKHSNIKQDLKSQNKKQTLTVKGELRSRVDILSPTKSRLLSPTTKSKILLTR